MSEICLECLKKLTKDNPSKEKYILSKDLDLCEFCGEWKRVVVKTQSDYSYVVKQGIFLPFKALAYVFKILMKLIKNRS